MKILEIVVIFIIATLVGSFIDALVLAGNTLLNSSECTVFTWNKILPNIAQLIWYAIGSIIVTSSKVTNWNNKHPKVLLIMMIIGILLCIPFIFINLC